MRLGIKNNGNLEQVIDLSASKYSITSVDGGHYLSGCGHGQWYAQEDYARALKDKKEFEDSYKKRQDKKNE